MARTKGLGVESQGEIEGWELCALCVHLCSCDLYNKRRGGCTLYVSLSLYRWRPLFYHDNHILLSCSVDRARSYSRLGRFTQCHAMYQ